jgi:hypothetical protein
MLKPASDRLDYGELMAPPPGFSLVSAVGTTYSLDFDALVGVCIAIGLSQNTDNCFLKNPIYILEALRQTGDKILLLCEAGQIQTPSSVSPLYILLEKIVYEVKLDKRGAGSGYPAFHPKFWLIKYIDGEDKLLYRVIVLSRNLTFDHSWDVAVAVDGEPAEDLDLKSQPIADFLKFIRTNLNDGKENTRKKRRMIDGLITEISNVRFDLKSREFDDFSFIPVGSAKNGGGLYSMYDEALFCDTFHEVLIMSPFLTGSVIDEFNSRNKNITKADYMLITRRSALEDLKPEQCGNFDIYAMKDTIVDGESIISEDENVCRTQDIHAKLFMWRKYSDTHLYLGSLNASYSALNRNIEFAIKLNSKRRYLDLATLSKSLFGGDPDNPDNPFEPVQLPDKISKDSDPKDDLERRIKILCRTKAHASVKISGETYSIDISFFDLPDLPGISISPLLSNKTMPVAQQVIIEELTLLQLSGFYRITAESEGITIQRVIKIETDGLPENRERSVVNSIIKDRQCFFQYLEFLLGEDYLMSAVETHAIRNSGFLNGQIIQGLPSLYERMLMTAATDPQRFAEIDYIMKMVTNDDIIPEDFLQLYRTFRKAAGADD